jgi:hypothetical protein
MATNQRLERRSQLLTTEKGEEDGIRRRRNG